MAYTSRLIGRLEKNGFVVEIHKNIFTDGFGQYTVHNRTGAETYIRWPSATITRYRIFGKPEIEIAQGVSEKTKQLINRLL